VTLDRNVHPGTGSATDAAPTPTDQWFERLAKYIPAEALGIYLALEGIVRAQTSLSVNANRVWLGVTLLVAVIFGWFYLEHAWNVRAA
jgi:hypothetical protein